MSNIVFIAIGFQHRFLLHVSSRIVHKSSACILNILVLISLSLFYRSYVTPKLVLPLLKFSLFGKAMERSKIVDISVGVLLKLSKVPIVSDILSIGIWEIKFVIVCLRRVR